MGSERAAGIACAILFYAGALAAGELSLPVGANSWVFDDSGMCTPARITANDGIKQWSDAKQRIRTFIWIGVPGPLEVRLTAAITSGTSQLRCTMDGEAKVVSITNTVPGSIAVGTFAVERPGYHYLELQGISKTAPTFAEITSMELLGAAVPAQIHYLKDDFHFGRRGPSVHLGYRLPKEARDICWYYNEVRVPVGSDIVGTYCMANGFGEGYSGMQVNSLTERRILFSVWSPFSTDDPKKIPEADRVITLKKGKDVHAQTFGGEGSGGQSYLIFPWKAGALYRFLLSGRPSGDGSTVYTTYFCPPETGQWQLIASFRRPKTDKYLTNWHSFLENFSTDTGAITREAHYANQWACDNEGHWFEATVAGFTADATAGKKARFDFTGGIATDGSFFLRNCGFFDGGKPANPDLTRKPGEMPVIDLSVLPQE